MRPSALSLTLALSGLLAACAPATTQSQQVRPAPVGTAPTPAPAPVQSFTVVSSLSATPVRTFSAPPTQVIDPAKQYRAILKTSRGDVTVELLPKASPVAVNNFVFLALNRFYDGTRFHRVIDGFMAQGGDPLSADEGKKAQWGTGGPGYQFAAEVNNGLRFDRAGVLGMARAQSLNSQGSQFFITVAPADFLSGGYTVFGRVLSGQDVLDRLTRTYNNAGPIAGAGADLLQSVQILQSP
ncbi:peptidylprolyl isomerase [Deinococcus multiflagellatus]|uniref:Peptidyl-prolyl cis-trans isomerase n=1 Tax=Deinococcus multiflagellatus TaxID=1656887 RepID=A0ABW1ZMM4_9DEIO|nr:peptidylprolyl isomerase [Deinococcus multiflagellatus]MBZ9714228.1 peptidylprolyl isomerase [Deinococcus multiflagellatus]